MFAEGTNALTTGTWLGAPGGSEGLARALALSLAGLRADPGSLPSTLFPRVKPSGSAASSRGSSLRITGGSAHVDVSVYKMSQYLDSLHVQSSP